MKKIEDLKKVLNFYVKSNILKTKVYDEINNYTISDYLYGTISLAIAIDSEFKETENVSKIIKMMILDEFSKINPNFNIEKELKKGKELQELINEARKMETKESKLAFKYRMLDFILTNLITTRTDLSQYEIIEEGVKCFNPKTEDEYNSYKEIVRFYILNFRLKDKNRTGWDKEHWNIKSYRIERVAEHIVSTILLAIAMESEMNYNEKIDSDRNVDLDRVIKMLSIHEIGETIIGDITPFDGITPKQKQELEYKAVNNVIGNLKNKTELLELYSEFESHISNESFLSYYCDKVEADLQSKYYQETNQHRRLEDQSTNKVMSLDITKKLIEEGAKTPFDIWYEYDKKIYQIYKPYSEFSDLLIFIRDNKMIRDNLDPVKEKVKLSEEEYSFLTSEITKFLDYAINDSEVEAVTQINIPNGEFDKGAIVIDLVIAENSLCSRQQVMIEKLNEQFKNINFTEIPVIFRFQSITDYYNYLGMSNSKVLKDRLYISKILLDKTGRITNLHEEGDNKKLNNPTYTIDYVPPFENEIIRNLKK